MTWTRPVNRSLCACISLEAGTLTMSTPAIILNSSPAKLVRLPVPVEVMLILPGLALA